MDSGPLNYGLVTTMPNDETTNGRTDDRTPPRPWLIWCQSCDGWVDRVYHMKAIFVRGAFLGGLVFVTDDAPKAEEILSDRVASVVRKAPFDAACGAELERLLARCREVLEPQRARDLHNWAVREYADAAEHGPLSGGRALPAPIDGGNVYPNETTTRSPHRSSGWGKRYSHAKWLRYLRSLRSAQTSTEEC